MWKSIRDIVEMAAHALLLVSIVVALPLILWAQVMVAAFPQIGA